MLSRTQYESLETVAEVLAKVSSKFVFTGGATIILYVDSLIQDELRITKDVDCVIDIANMVGTLIDRFREIV